MHGEDPWCMEDAAVTDAIAARAQKCEAMDLNVGMCPITAKVKTLTRFGRHRTSLAHAWLGPLVHERRGSHGRHRGPSPEMLSYTPERWYVPYYS